MSAAMDLPVEHAPDREPRLRRLTVVGGAAALSSSPPASAKAHDRSTVTLLDGRQRVSAPTVTQLHALPRAVPRSGLRLTPRGRLVVALAALTLAAMLVGLARLSHPHQPAAMTPVSYSSVLVQSGDTLWSIAGRVAPARDPRAEVDLLRSLNSLRSVDVTPGQILWVK